MKICIDPGHGGLDSGCIGFGILEKNLNLEYARLLRIELQKYKDVEILMTREGDSNPSLLQRATLANQQGCDLYISCHLNAYNGEARGTETIHSIYAKFDFIQLCRNIATNISKNLGIPFRRTFSRKGNNGDYYGVIRETKMPAIIVEALFLDNEEDIKKFDSRKIVRAITEAIVEHYKLKHILEDREKTTKLYRVVVGSYKDKKNALRKQGKLKEKSFIWEVKNS